MKNWWSKVLPALIVAVGLSGVALGAGFLTNGMPQAGNAPFAFTIPFTGNELVPLDTQLAAGQAPQSESASLLQLQGYFGGQVNPWRNALIGGDFTTNLFQRGTTSASITTAVLYGPDRWFGWSGTNTAFTIARDSTAANLPTGFRYAAKVQRTAAQTGVVPVCMSQVVESANVYQFQGKVAEFSFWETTGATFSPTNANITAYVTYGTGADEGSVNLAFGLNAGGGGAAAWTGQTNAAAVTLATGTLGGAPERWTVAASIPATATELAATICWTPVGTAGANDWISFAGMQLAVNQSLAQYAGTGALSTSIPASAFDRRPQAVETELQQRYYWLYQEANTFSAAACGPATGANLQSCSIKTPVTMRAAATVTVTAGGFQLVIDGAAAAAVTTMTAATSTVNELNFTTANTLTAAAHSVLLRGSGTTGSVAGSAEL